MDEVIPDAERDAILKEAASWVATHGAEEEESAETVHSVAVTSYEGSKDRSAQYVSLANHQAMPPSSRTSKCADFWLG